MIRIFLIGFMGAGKTTLGRYLASELGVSFCDLDIFIEQRFRKSVSDIFAQHGEAGFREIERNMLHEVGEFEDVVIACGGSTPLFFDNMDYMLARGETIYLNASVDTLVRRLKEARSKRPLIAQKSDEELELFVKSEIKRREPGYLRAKHICSADSLESIDQISVTVKEVKRVLKIE